MFSCIFTIKRNSKYFQWSHFYRWFDGVIEVIVSHPDFEFSEKEIETYVSNEELKFPNEHNEGI